MTSKTQHLQVMFARRREAEHLRAERTQAVDRYFDHWGKVTSRFENWTTEEYYKQADEQFQAQKTKKEKLKKLEERREKLKQLLHQEKQQYELELKELENPRTSRFKKLSTKTLEKIDENVKERDYIRRKLELEAKLYGKWRHGVDDDKLLFESKSDHEVIAKLNWLDRQVEEQLTKEAQQAEAKQYELKMQEEINKTEQLQKERQKIRQKEIEEIRQLQEIHLAQLKERQHESEELKLAEENIKQNMNSIIKELMLLEESYENVQQKVDFGQAFNLNKIKVFLRKRSEAFRCQLKLLLLMLERTLPIAKRSEEFREQIQKLQEEIEMENLKIPQVEAMYESEAKHSLHKCENIWRLQHTEHYKLLKELLQNEHFLMEMEMKENLKRQEDLIDIRATHLSAIESSSEKLKQLIKEEEDSPRGIHDRHTPDINPTDMHLNLKSISAAPVRNDSQHGAITKSHLPEVTSTFNNLNLDVWHDSCLNSPASTHCSEAQCERALQVVTPDTAERPKFGRKRVAWT